MKAAIRKLDETEVRSHFPEADLLPGWFFRVRELSMGHFLVEGTDLWGHTVSIHASNYVLTQAVEAARNIQRQLST